MNARQTKFVEHYLKTGNGTQAALAAGYSPKTAHVIACNLLKNVNVAGAVQEAQAKAITAGIVTLEEAMKIVSDIARCSKNEFAKLQAVGVLERLGGWCTSQDGPVTLRVVYGDLGHAVPEHVVAPDKPVVEQSVQPPAPTPKAPPRKLFSEPTKPQPAARVIRPERGVYTLGEN